MSESQALKRKELSSMRLGSYNVLIPRTDTEGKGLASWLERRAAVVETIEASADLIGLQECSFHEAHCQGQYIADELAQLGWQGYIPKHSKLFADEFHERLPIFWRENAFTPDEAGQLLLSSWTPEELEKVPILENRYGSFVAGELKNGQRLLFITLHLQHTTARADEVEAKITELKRLEAHGALGDFIESRPTEEAICVGGDFNSTNSPHRLSKRLSSIDEVSEKLSRWEFGSFHDWQDSRGEAHLDKIFVSEGLFGGVGAIGESLASDHYPVTYEVTLKEPRGVSCF